MAVTNEQSPAFSWFYYNFKSLPLPLLCLVLP